MTNKAVQSRIREARDTNAQQLALSGWRLKSLPGEIGDLSNLQSLAVSDNGLKELPEWLAGLSNLHFLNVDNNGIEALPNSLTKLRKLTWFLVDTNPLTQLPPGVAKNDSEILAYLRRLAEEGERQWPSKLFLVGEGGAGKTSVLRSLLGESFNFKEETTHGIDETGAKVTMTLNAWDFAGQEIYHATHQFFLSNRSLFLLV